MKALVEPLGSSGLRLEEVRLGTGESVDVGDSDDDTLLFCSRGAGALALAGETHTLGSGAAPLVLPGEQADVSAGGEGLALLVAGVGPEAESHAPLGAREVVAVAHGADERAAGSRSFRVLFGPHNGSLRATMFLGYVPPGLAPWHYHLYDEIVWLPHGPARLHRAERVEDLGAGAAFELRARDPHILENTGRDVLELLGLFTPAGSPAAAYLVREDFAT